MVNEHPSKIQPIVGYGSPILHQECIEVDQTGENFVIILDLIHTMDSMKTAVGLAAPQINSRIRAFTMKVGNEIIPVINPVIIKSDLLQTSKEGCLSIPELFEYVKRPGKIDVEYYDINWNKVRNKFRGFPAVIFQHEYDHLLGILFTDRLDPKKQEEIQYKLNNIKTGHTKSYYPMQYPDSPFIQIPKI